MLPSPPKLSVAKKRPLENGHSPANEEDPIASPPAEEEDHDVEEEDNDESKPRGKKRKMTGVSGGPAAAVAAVASLGATGSGAATNPVIAAAGGMPHTEYRYTQEIGQMLYVFGEVVNPLEETSRMVEDIVRGQLIELLIRARALTVLRASRYLTSDDLLFLIRQDKFKVARLKNYLAWKDVRKRVKQDQESKGDDVNVEEELGAGDETADKKPVKQVVKLPWELLTPFTEFLRTLPVALGTSAAGADDDDDDEEELEAYEESLQRLRESDALTRKMTKEEYIHFSECRQASFTYRKAKKFRDFLNHTAYLDLKPNDDVTDILGFLSFEMVRTLCVAALDIRRGLSDDPNQAVGNAAKIDAANRADQVEDGSLRDADKVDESAQPSTAASPGGDARPAHGTTTNAHRLAPAPPLQPRYILAAYQKAQRDEMSVRTGGMGLRNFRGGVVRRKVAII